MGEDVIGSSAVRWFVRSRRLMAGAVHLQSPRQQPIVEPS
jgi:hypothetical protein